VPPHIGEHTLARAAIKAVNGILLGESEAAMYLEPVIGHAQSHFVAEDLGNRGHEGADDLAAARQPASCAMALALNGASAGNGDWDYECAYHRDLLVAIRP
jgi:hypothetical protein